MELWPLARTIRLHLRNLTRSFKLSKDRKIAIIKIILIILPHLLKHSPLRRGEMSKIINHWENVQLIGQELHIHHLYHMMDQVVHQENSLAQTLEADSNFVLIKFLTMVYKIFRQVKGDPDSILKRKILTKAL